MGFWAQNSKPPGTPPHTPLPSPESSISAGLPEARRVRCACTPPEALLRRGLDCTLLAVLFKATSTQGTHSAEPLLAAFAQMEDVHRNTPLANIQISGFGRYIPAWCQRDMSHYLANLCLHCILQVGITTGLYPEARVSICMNLSQQTLLFCRGNKLSTEKICIQYLLWHKGFTLSHSNTFAHLHFKNCGLQNVIAALQESLTLADSEASHTLNEWLSGFTVLS